MAATHFKNKQIEDVRFPSFPRLVETTHEAEPNPHRLDRIRQTCVA
jgi:hypothetical protein